MSVHDLVIGAIKDRSWHHISSWVNSLDRSGFTGTKMMICYDRDPVMAKKLINRGYLIQNIQPIFEVKSRIHVDRFGDIAEGLKHQIDRFRYVVFTDVTDVIFQKDPTVILESILANHDIAVCGEGIRYRDEEWGRDIMKAGYGEAAYNTVKDREVVNCGVIAGTNDAITTLLKDVWELATKGSVGMLDQQALNLLLLSPPYRSRTRILNSADGWTAHLGCHPEAMPEYADKLVDTPAVFLPDGYVVTPNLNTGYSIVHQYNRVMSIRQKIWDKFWEAE